MSDFPSQPNSETEKRLMNGEFYAKRDKIFRAPIETKTETGTNVSVGFPVCHVSDYVDPANLVEVLNASREVDGLKARIQELEEALREIAEPLKLKVDGIGLHRTLALINRMSSIAKDALVEPDAQPKDTAK